MTLWLKDLQEETRCVIDDDSFPWMYSYTAVLREPTL